MNPSQLAAFLGLSTDPSKKPVPLAEERAKELLDSMAEIYKLDSQKSDRFWAEFGALYLPSFYNLLIETPFPYNSNVLLQLQNLFTHDGLDSWVGKSARTRPDDTTRLWIVTLERVSQYNHASVETWFRSLQDTPGNIRKGAFVCFIELIFLIIYHVKDFFPLDLPLPLPSIAAQARLKTLIPALRMIIEQEDLLRSKRASIVWTSLTYLLCTADGHQFTSRQLRAASAAQESHAAVTEIWTTCQALMDGVVKKDTCRSGLEDMMMCSRCQTVRYCSTAHQKSHWKRHKNVCFASNW